MHLVEASTQGIRQFHQLRNRCVELKLILEIVTHFGNRRVHSPANGLILI